MAIISYSALINTISGLLSGVVHLKRGGTDFTRAMPTNYVDPASPRQLQLRANFTAVSDAFDLLSDSQVDLWNGYALRKNIRGGSLPAHRKLNCNLLHASHSDLTINSAPPTTPSTPRFPMGFCVMPLNTTTVRLSWTDPDQADNYVTAGFRTTYGFCKRHPCYADCMSGTAGRRWRFVKTERSDQLAIQHVHAWPSNTRLIYRLNSIDKAGRQSPYTHSIQVTTPT